MPGKGRPFQPGQSGNPKGRPPKPRALTEILERGGAKTVEVDGKRVSGKALVSSLVWQGVLTRRVKFPDGEEIKLLPYHWLELVKWLYGHVDGPPRAEFDVSTDGVLRILVEYESDDPSPTGEAAPDAGEGDAGGAAL